MPRWETPPPEPGLPAGDVHVWRVGLDERTVRVDELAGLLSSAEKERAERFRFPEDRTRYTVAHGALRLVLSRYLRASPRGLEFVVGEHGKPRLAEPGQSGDLQFNLSDSHHLALVAVTRGREVGVDIERLDREVEAMEIAEHAFAPAEIEALRAVPEPERRDAFFRCWTRKEAFAKARGTGLLLPLSTFTVSVKPGERPALRQVEGDPLESSRWTLLDLDPGPGYTAALAVERGWERLRCWQK
jgi:4'-phosphopantetheinyl transferase